jgi:hypothetical protein
MSLTRTRRRLLFAFVPAALAASLVLWDQASQAATQAAITFRWTAPGDDGAAGQASRYDIRYSTNAIAGTDTLSWWNAATIVNMGTKVPAAPGQPDSIQVSGLTSGVRYYAMIRTADEIPNWSPFSNLAIFQIADTVPPNRIADLGAR